MEHFMRERGLSEPSLIRETLLGNQEDSDLSENVKRVSFKLEL